jgi:hypothetical protein
MGNEHNTILIAQRNIEQGSYNFFFVLVLLCMRWRWVIVLKRNLMFCWPCIIVYQFNETKVMHFSFNLLRIKGLYMFRLLLDHPQDARKKQSPLILNKLNEKCITLVSLYLCTKDFITNTVYLFIWVAVAKVHHIWNFICLLEHINFIKLKHYFTTAVWQWGVLICLSQTPVCTLFFQPTDSSHMFTLQVTYPPSKI